MMYKDDFERTNYSDRNSEDVYSKPVRAGKRTYFFDVKATKGNNDYFLTITESKRRTNQDGSFSFDKHKIFLYKEDFVKFTEGLEEVIAYVKDNYLKDLPEQSHSPADFDDSQESCDAMPENSLESGKFTDVEFEEL